MRHAWIFLLILGCIPDIPGPALVEDSAGYEKGEVVPDFTLIDQHGEEVTLSEFEGSVVVLDVSTMWCVPCQKLSAHTEALYQERINDDFMYLTLLQEDVNTAPPTIENLNQWADSFGITAPVLADGDKSVAAVIDGTYPAVLVIDRDMTVHERVNPVDDALLREVLDELF